MAKSKKIKVGSLLATEVDDKATGAKKRLLSVALGTKSPHNPQNDLSVEITVKDSKGNIVAQQKDGYLDLIDPRKQPDELFAAGLIDKSMRDKMLENVSKISEKVKYQVMIKSNQ